MKEIYILSCYPNVPEKERLLIETVDKLKSLGKTVLIASHFAVPDYIVKKCDYYIYDAYNMLDMSNHTLDNHGTDYWVRINNFLMETTITHHASALSRMFGITMNFIKSIGYDYFIILESDSEYHIDDLKKFDLYKKKLVENNKKMFFFSPKYTEFSWNNSRVYETYCFGGFLDYFLNTFKFPIDIESWTELVSNNKNYNCFEYLLADKFIHSEKDYLVMGTLKSQFVNSKIDLFTVGESSGLFFNVSDENRPIVFLHNHDSLQRKSVYEIKINMQPMKVVELNCGEWSYYSVDFNFENTISIVINTYRDNKLYSVYTDYFTKDNMHQKKLYKRITFTN